MSLLRFVNIDFGLRAEEFIDNLAGSPNARRESIELSNKTDSVINKRIRGKLTIKKYKLFSEDVFYYKYIIYIISSIIQLVIEWVTKCVTNKGSLVIIILHIVFYSRKFHFMFFNSVFFELYSRGFRTILHANFIYLDTKNRVQYLCTVLSLIFSLLDIKQLMTSIYNLKNSKRSGKNNIQTKNKNPEDDIDLNKDDDGTNDIFNRKKGQLKKKKGLRMDKKLIKTSNMRKNRKIRKKMEQNRNLGRSKNSTFKRNTKITKIHDVNSEEMNNKSKDLIKNAKKTIDFDKTFLEIKKNKAIQAHIQMRHLELSPQTTISNRIHLVSGIYYS